MSSFPLARVAFDLAAVIAIVFAGFMVVLRHPVKSVLAVVVSFFFLAVGYVLLFAPFIAALQVIVYAGAILVLFLFVLMLLNVESDRSAAGGRRPIQAFLSGLSLLVFVAILLGVFRTSGSDVRVPAGAPAASGLGEIGPLARLVFTDYLLPFEALSVLLLAALVGAFVLARREEA